VGAAPELLFIPDRNGDDRPDGKPEVVLDGWGWHDTHETLNSFAWGPDGWLYGCHGVFTHSRVGKPGTPDSQRTPINAGVWRYHPQKGTFEVFAHGTSNPWGLDWDERGRMFITACVIPHLYYVIQGGRYERQAGTHFNPYTYDDLKTIADHRHYLGGNPHAGNGRSAAAGGGHAHAGALIYLGGDWPAEYQGSIFMNNIHGARLNRDVFKAKGSGFIGMHAPDFLLANDSWSQIVSLKQAPDGGVYLLDWYDKNQCHRGEVDLHDRSNGRIFKITYGPPRRVEVDLAKAEDDELLAALGEDEWSARHARRILQERGSREEIREHLEEMLAGFAARPWVRVRALCALHTICGLEEGDLMDAFEDPDPSVRAWAVRLGAESGRVSPVILGRYAELARTDPSAEVRLAIASALQRLPEGDRWKPLEGLLGQAVDANDPNLPLMIWYAAEPLGGKDPGRAMKLVESTVMFRVLGFMARRIASARTDEALRVVLGSLERVSDRRGKLAILEGIAAAYAGVRVARAPESWGRVAAALVGNTDPRIRQVAIELGAMLGDPAMIKVLRARVSNAAIATPDRITALNILARGQDPELAGVLVQLVEQGASAGQGELLGAAVRALSAYPNPTADRLLLRIYPRLAPDLKRDVLNTLAARKTSARLLLEALAAGSLPRSDLTADLARQIANLGDPELDQRLGQVWGTIRKTSAERAALIARYRALLSSKPAHPPDPALGRAVFAKVCQQCHTLFDQGGKVGPDLTGSNRADLDYLLSNVLDPSAVVGKDYQASVIALADGRVLTGIIKAEDEAVIQLATANETLSIAKREIEDRKLSQESMMPDDLWKPLSEHEIRSLTAYLASPVQVPLPASAGSSGSLP